MKKKEKTRGKAAGLISTAALCAAVALCMLICFQVATRGYAGFFGYSLFRVVTGSMEPTLPVNTLIACKSTPIEEIRVGDIVVFRSQELEAERIITHRVVSVVSGESGAPLLETRGDANPVADRKLVGAYNLIGKVVWNANQESGGFNVIGFLGSGYGFIACIVFPLLVLGGLILRGSLSNIRRQLCAATEALNASQKSDPGAQISKEEYDEMYDRIKAEVLQELKQNNER